MDLDYILTRWNLIRNHCSGLDLSDPEDRSIFRARIGLALMNTKVATINKWINDDGIYRSRRDAMRQLTNELIGEETK